MNEINNSANEASGRRGGRSARKALREAPLAENIKPVHPGMNGGLFKPLSDNDVKKIHKAVLTVLEEVGFADAIPSCVDAVCKMGGFVNEHNRLCMPASLVEDVIANAARNFTLYAQDPAFDMHPWDTKLYFGTAGAAVHVVDPFTGDYRDSTLKDLYNAARIIDNLEHIHFMQRPIVARDMVDPCDLDVNTCYASVMGTKKHVGTSWVDPDHFDKSMQMLHYIAGGEEKWRKRPFVSMSSCFVVPPMKFATDACRCLESAVHAGMPILLLAAGQAGATSPAALAGAIVQEVAEVLGGLVYVNAIRRGAPAIFGTWPFVSDLRTGAMSGGSGEQALLMSGCAQMARHYNLTGGVTAGMADSKIPDAQSGYEKGINYSLVGHSGANLVYEAAGMHASLLGFCLESLVIDNDAIGSVLRTVRGIDVNDDTLSVETIRDVCINGPGHFLGSNQTLGLMQSEYIYPLVGDRTSPKEWEENKRPTIVQTAHNMVNEIIDNYALTHISKAQDDGVRKLIDVKLPQTKMKFAN